MKKVKRLKALLLSACMTAAAMTSSLASFSAVSADESSEYNLAKLLQYSSYFYDANMCGCGVSDNSQFTWRGDCHTYDSQVPLNSQNTNLSDSFISKYKDVLDPDGDGYVDVSGGFHDAGDHVKFGMPENYADIMNFVIHM